MAKFVLVAVAFVPLRADTIHLKKGGIIQADRTRQAGAKVEYDIGDDHYAIPLALVDRIDAGGAPAASAVAAAGHRADVATDIPAIVASRPGVPADLGERLVRDGRVDTELLAAIEAAGDPRVTAFAYDAAGVAEQAHGNFERADADLLHGLRLAPDTALLQGHYASLLMVTEQYSRAVPYAERAAKLAPDSPDYLALLGFAYFLADRSRDAVAPWKRSLALQPSDNVSRYLARAQRELAVEANYGQQATSHFTLRYEGSETSPTLRRQILAALQADFDQYAADFGVSPRENIPVILYTNQAFVDVTEMPGWADALNDGKLRIPIDHLEAMTDDLARVLRHELAHSFINYLSRGRAPQWLHEGIAQLEEPRALGARGRLLARLADNSAWQPFNALEADFMQLNTQQAALAYSESLAAADFIRQAYGMSSLSGILKRIGEGSSTESALRATIHSGYDGLQQDVTAYLRKTYGQ